jgi:hypothetical protein
MIEFLEIVTSFPTAVYTVLLLVVMVHWFLSALGILEIDTIDGLMPDGFGGHDVGGHALGHHDVGAGHAGSHHGGHHHENEANAGFLMKFGLHGVPIMVIVTIIAIVGWLFTYFADLYVLRTLSLGPFSVLADILAIVGGLLLAIPVGRIVLAPVRRLLRRYEPVTQRPLLGRYAEVRSPEITQTHGTAWVEDGGAGLILQVRADAPGVFMRGDRVVLIEYLEDQNAYRVISGEEFEKL